MSYYIEVWGKAIVKEKYRQDFELYISQKDWENVSNQELKEIGMRSLDAFSIFTCLCNDGIYHKDTGQLDFNFEYNQRSKREDVLDMYGAIFPVIFESLIEIDWRGEDDYSEPGEPEPYLINYIKGYIKDYLLSTYSLMPNKGYIECSSCYALEAFYAKWLEADDVERFMPYKMREDEEELSREKIEKMIGRIKSAFEEYLEYYYLYDIWK